MDRRATKQGTHPATCPRLAIVVLLLGIVAAGCSATAARSRAAAATPDACAAEGLPEPRVLELSRSDPPLGARIAEVEIQGTSNVPKAVVFRAVGQLEGRPYDGDEIAAATRRVFELEAFEDVAVLAEDHPKGTKLTFRVLERPVLRSARLRGSGGSPLVAEPGMPYEPARLVRWARQREAELSKAGYPHARVELRAVRSGQAVDLCVVERAGPERRVARLRFRGNAAVGSWELRQAMHTGTSRLNVPGGPYRPDALDQNLERWQALYYDRGFIEVRITPRVVEHDGGYDLRIDIDEGKQFRLGRVVIRGPRLASVARYRKLLGVAQGEIFSRSKLAEGLRHIGTLHEERGKPELAVAPEVDIDRERRTVDLVLRLESP